jgi:transposase-like protein
LFGSASKHVEELLAERGLDISSETVRSWVLKFGPAMPAARYGDGYFHFADRGP